MANQNGNALLIILIAIALLAGLTMVMADLEGGGEFDTDYEQMRAATSQLTNFSAALGTAVHKVTNYHDCDASQIDFNADTFNSVNYAHAAENPRCKIFHPKGGGMSYIETDDVILDDSAGNDYRVTGQQVVDGIGTTDPELTFMALITREACLYLNDKLSIPTTADEPPVADNMAHDIAYVFNGGNSAGGDFTAGFTLDHADLSARNSGCVHDSNDDKYIYYKVLLAR